MSVIRVAPVPQTAQQHIAWLTGGLLLLGVVMPPPAALSPAELAWQLQARHLQLEQQWPGALSLAQARQTLRVYLATGRPDTQRFAALAVMAGEAAAQLREFAVLTEQNRQSVRLMTAATTRMLQETPPVAAQRELQALQTLLRQMTAA